MLYYQVDYALYCPENVNDNNQHRTTFKRMYVKKKSTICIDIHQTKNVTISQELVDVNWKAVS